MTFDSKPAPSYNLGVITRETGLNPDTLRAWERRYQLPQPTRSAGRQRLYSQRDLEIIKWLIARQEAGLRISQAAKEFHAQVAQGLDPLQRDGPAADHLGIPLDNRGTIEEYKSHWVAACLSFNETQAEQTIVESFSQYPPETVCFEVLFAGLSEIGDYWYEGKASVQQEHFASGLVARRLNALISGAPSHTRPERIVLAAPENEDHILSALLITYLLRRRGWDVICLGADVPLANFRDTIKALQPALIILTAQQLLTAATLLDFANVLAGMNTMLAYGGLVFNRIPTLRQSIPGFFLGEELTEVVPNIEKLFLNRPKQQEAQRPNSAPLLEDFKTMLPTITRLVNEALSAYPDLKPVHNRDLSRGVLSALKLGDISFMSSDLDWLRGLLSNFEVPEDVLPKFLGIYHQAVDEARGESAAPVLDWLKEGMERIIGNELSNGETHI